MYSKPVMKQVTEAFNRLNATQIARRKDCMISHFLLSRFYVGKYTVAEKRCLVLRAYVRAYDRQLDGKEVYLYPDTPLFTILASLLGKDDAQRHFNRFASQTQRRVVNEAMSVARLAIMAMDAEDEQR